MSNQELPLEKFTITVVKDKEPLQFEIAEYPHHHHEDRCKFEVFQSGEFIAAFEPDSRRHLHLCKNPGSVDEEVLHLIADKIETLHW